MQFALGVQGATTVAVRHSHEGVPFPRLGRTQETASAREKVPGKGQHAQNIRRELSRLCV